MANINSFSQNINQLISQGANQLSMLTAIQDAFTSNDSFTTFDYTGTDGETIQYQIPSYESIVNRLRAVEESLNALNEGKGTINLSDGTRRTLTLSSVPSTPQQITGISDPSTFTIDANWFFEDLMFPGAQVEVDLTNQIEDTADRVRVMRIILNSADEDSTTLWDSDLSSNSYDYVSLITILNNNNISYYIDEETIDMPLVSNQVSGSFQITTDVDNDTNNVWYTLDTLTYSTISENGVDQGQNNILSVGDQLSYSDSIFEIIEIDQNNNMVRLKRINGVQTPGVYSTLSYYQDPYRSKTVKVRFGAHEYDIIYFKGINESLNLLADSWSTPIKFSTDDLVLAGSTDLQQTQFASYYAQYIVDWGSDMIAQAKEKKISAWYGQTPNAPTLNADDLRVVQINTQINAAIDTTDVKNTAAEIESVKSQISSLKSTIAAQKTDLQSATSTYTYNSIQQQIATNTTDLTNLQTTYSTLVDSFQSLVKENSAITTDPKYHIRGFFAIPEYKYRDEAQTIAEYIIGFDIAYRYIKEDSTATQLNTFTYTAADGTEVTGTFTDWVVTTGPMKTKTYDSDTQQYVWVSENVADGTETNINQIDIAINKGEKVEIKVRSISEAGYPENPLRSEWSNSITVEFPSTLATSNEIADLITKVNDDALNITITNTLDSIGVTTHLDDTVPNTNSVNGMYFKHMADNIAVEEKGTTAEGTSVVNSISLQDKLDSMTTGITQNNSSLVKSISDISVLNASMTASHSVYEQNFSNINTSIYILNSSVDTNTSLIKSIRTDEGYVQSARYVVKDSKGNVKVELATLDTTSSNLFVLDKTDTSTDSYVGTVNVKDINVYPNRVHDGVDTGGYSLNTRLDGVDASIITNRENIALAETHIGEVSTRVVDVAYKSDVSFVQNQVTTLRNEMDGIKDGSNIIADDLLIGMDNTRLSSNKATGHLYVFEGQSAEQMGILHVEDVQLHTGGYLTGAAVSLTTISDTVTEHDTKISDLENDLDTVSGIVNAVAYQTDDTNYSLRATSAEISGTIHATTISGENFVIDNGAPFYAKNGTNTAQLVDGHFKNLYIHRTGEQSSNDIMSVYNEIMNVSTAAYAAKDYADRVQDYVYDDIDSGSNTAGVSITAINIAAEYEQVKKLVFITNDDSGSSATNGVTVANNGGNELLVTELGSSNLCNIIASDFVVNLSGTSGDSTTTASLTAINTDVERLVDEMEDVSTWKNAVYIQGTQNDYIQTDGFYALSQGYMLKKSETGTAYTGIKWTGEGETSKTLTLIYSSGGSGSTDTNAELACGKITAYGDIHTTGTIYISTDNGEQNLDTYILNKFKTNATMEDDLADLKADLLVIKNFLATLGYAGS